MITVTAVLARIPGLDAATLDLFVEQDWVRPARHGGDVVFAEIDVARLQLIQDLRGPLDMGDAAIPVVLSLLDQLHATRRQMQRLRDALEQASPRATAHDVLRQLIRP